MRAAVWRAQAKQSKEAFDAYDEGVRLAADAPSRIKALLLWDYGNIARSQNDWKRAEDCYTRSLEESRKVTRATLAQWVAIFGNNLAMPGDSRTWNADTEIVNGVLPVRLDGVSVSVNGKPAVVEFISPTQVNIQPPDDAITGPVQIVVTTSAGASKAFTVNYAQFAPGLFPGAAPYIVAQHADSSYVTAASPAKPGEVIVLWGTGFGSASPPVPPGHVFSGANPLANPVTVTIGGESAQVVFAGVVLAGLCRSMCRSPPTWQTAMPR
jgi:uncharacterized protein (TIGR03437 family)